MRVIKLLLCVCLIYAHLIAQRWDCTLPEKTTTKKKNISPQAWTAHSWIFPKNGFFFRLQFHKKSEQTSVTSWMVLKQRENRTTSTCHSPLFRKNSSCTPAEDCFSPSVLFAAEVLSYERIFSRPHIEQSSLYQCFPTLNAPEMRNQSTSKHEEGPTKQEAKTSSQH